MPEILSGATVNIFWPGLFATTRIHLCAPGAWTPELRYVADFTVGSYEGMWGEEEKLMTTMWEGENRCWRKLPQRLNMWWRWWRNVWRGLVASEVLTSNSCRDSSGCCSTPHYSMSRSGGQSSLSPTDTERKRKDWKSGLGRVRKTHSLSQDHLFRSSFFAPLYTPLSSDLSFPQLVLWFLCLPSPARPAAVPSHLSGL